MRGEKKCNRINKLTRQDGRRVNQSNINVYRVKDIDRRETE